MAFIVGGLAVALFAVMRRDLLQEFKVEVGGLTRSLEGVDMATFCSHYATYRNQIFASTTVRKLWKDAEAYLLFPKMHDLNRIIRSTDRLVNLLPVTKVVEHNSQIMKGSQVFFRAFMQFAWWVGLIALLHNASQIIASVTTSFAVPMADILILARNLALAVASVKFWKSVDDQLLKRVKSAMDVHLTEWSHALQARIEYISVQKSNLQLMAEQRQWDSEKTESFDRLGQKLVERNSIASKSGRDERAGLGAIQDQPWSDQLNATQNGRTERATIRSGKHESAPNVGTQTRAADTGEPNAVSMRMSDGSASRQSRNKHR